MIEVKKILLPTDFSACANQALDHAGYLADRYGAELHMLHAIVLHDDDPFNAAAHFTDVEEIQQRLQDLARIEMKAVIRERDAIPHDVVMRQRRGISVADTILDYSGEEDIDLIVMGTHGRRGLGHLFLGSAAERVVRLARCPVLTFRQLEIPRAIKSLDRILVPVDYSEHARQAISHAREIAATYGASLDLLHVIDEAPRPRFYATTGPCPDVIGPEAKQTAREQMQRLYEAAGGPDVGARYQVTVGRAGDEIVGFAEKAGSGLIVMSSHGLSGIRRLLMGSVAERVVQTAPCPVFTVKSFGKSLVGVFTPLRPAETTTQPPKLATQSARTRASDMPPEGRCSPVNEPRAN
jgi:nucleotide-binding universal stress UspA family protein